MNKKGLADTLILVGEVGAVLLVGYLAFTLGTKHAESDLTFRTNTVQDIQMIVDVLVGVPGDAVIKYPSNLSEYSLAFSSSSITILKQSEGEEKWVTRDFILPEGYTAEGVVKQTGLICVEKQGKVISLNVCTNEQESIV